MTVGNVWRAAIVARWAAAGRLRHVFLFISITVSAASFAHVAAQEVTTVAPPATVPPADSKYPDAEPVVSLTSSVPDIHAAEQQIHGNVYSANGDVVLLYRGWTLHADHVEFDSDTEEAELSGHVVVEGAENGEHFEASHGSFNVRTETGRFYDATGSIGIRRAPPAPGPGHTRYTNSNPFLFTARVLTKAGPHEYIFDHGTFTSCQLPHPDWLLSASEFHVTGAKAHATNSIFRLLGVPLLWLPYATHPVDADSRQTGILIPEIGINSASKGDTVGEQVYWAVNRSTDMTVGTIYYSARGWERTAAIRYRGPGQDFARASYTALQDRGYTPAGGKYINQSGTDVLFSGRKDFEPGAELPPAKDKAPAQSQARMVAEVEYLSSFPYREAFSSNFNQAVSSDVLSTMYFTREWRNMAVSLEGDRYEGEKRIAPEQQVRIFHAPALEFTAADHPFGKTPLEWNLDSSITALKRTQPGFATSGMVERLDIHPELALPFGFAGWRARPSLAGRETFYSRSRLPAVAVVSGPPNPPRESADPLNRADVELGFDLRPPVVERTFTSGWFRRLMGEDVRHTIEPDFAYHYVHGIDNFPHVLRFDVTDVASDTNEMEYSLTQRLFLRRNGDRPCRAAGAAADAMEILGSAGSSGDAIEAPGEAAGRVDEVAPVCGDREWISWRVAQKFFFDSHFGGAVTATGPRSVLGTTLDFSGIAFLTGPRNISPLISRLRVRTSEKLDVEWDVDYDESAKKFTADNIYADVHWGDPADGARGYIFAGAGYARLNAPARSYVEGALSSVADFNQMRVLLGFGKPTRPGLSAAASAGIDLDLGTVQYGAIQTSYNWNCCGISVEYRKYELGSARNDNGYKFNFTLANIGSAGNLRHSDQVF